MALCEKNINFEIQKFKQQNQYSIRLRKSLMSITQKSVL